MIVKCKGTCGKIRTAQPYKSTRVVEYLCENCSGKYATKTVITKSVVHHRGISIFLSSRTTGKNNVPNGRKTK